MRHRDLRAWPACAWPAAAQNILRQFDPDVLLAADARGNGVRVAASTIPGGDRGIFADRRFDVGERFLPFFGQVIHHDLDYAASSQNNQLQHRLYGSGAFWTSARVWGKTAVELPTTEGFWSAGTCHTPPRASSASVATKRCRRFCPCFRSLWIAPASCCAGGLVNDYHHLPRVGAVTEDAVGPQRQANTEMVQRWKPLASPAQLTRLGVVHLRVTKVIEAGQEVLADYGPVYGYFSL